MDDMMIPTSTMVMPARLFVQARHSESSPTAVLVLPVTPLCFGELAAYAGDASAELAAYAGGASAELPEHIRRWYVWLLTCMLACTAAFLLACLPACIAVCLPYAPPLPELQC